MSQEFERGLTCSVTAFRVDGAPSDGVSVAQEWLGVATAEIYDGDHRPRGIQTREQAILATVVVRVIEGRVTATTQAHALVGALEALVYQLRALGQLPRRENESAGH